MQRTFFTGEDAIFGDEDSIFNDNDRPLCSDEEEFISGLFGISQGVMPSQANNPIVNQHPQEENVKKRQLDEQPEIDDESRKKRKVEAVEQVIPSPAGNQVVYAPQVNHEISILAAAIDFDEQKKQEKNERARKYRQALVYADMPTRNKAERKAALVPANARIEYVEDEPFVNQRPVMTINQSYTRKDFNGVARENLVQQNFKDKIVLGSHLCLSLPYMTAEMLPQVQYHLNEIEKLCSYYMRQKQRESSNFYSPTFFSPRQGAIYPSQPQPGAAYPSQPPPGASGLPSGLPRK